MRVDEDNYWILQKASRITGTDYDIRWFDAENIDGYIDTQNICPMIEDLLIEIDRLQEELDDLQEDIKDNYRHIPTSEQVGISDKDFI